MTIKAALEDVRKSTDGGRKKEDSLSLCFSRENTQQMICLSHYFLPIPYSYRDVILLCLAVIQFYATCHQCTVLHQRCMLIKIAISSFQVRSQDFAMGGGCFWGPGAEPPAAGGKWGSGGSPSPRRHRGTEGSAPRSWIFLLFFEENNSLLGIYCSYLKSFNPMITSKEIKCVQNIGCLFS